MDAIFTPGLFYIFKILVVDVIVDISDCIERKEDEGHEVERIESEVADTSRTALSLVETGWGQFISGKTSGKTHLKAEHYSC